MQVSCGGTHSVALTRDGRMFSVSTLHRVLPFLTLFLSLVKHFDQKHFIVRLCNYSCALLQFGRGDHGRLGYGRKMTTGHPSEVPINISPPKHLSSCNEAQSQGRWCAKYVACGGRHTLSIVEWQQTFDT